MKHLLLLAIKTYWQLWPRCWKRDCLHLESCSRHVYRITTTEGLRAGLRTLRRRMANCRPGYLHTCEGGVCGLRLSDGSFLPEELMSVLLRDSLQQHLSALEKALTESAVKSNIKPLKYN